MLAGHLMPLCVLARAALKDLKIEFDKSEEDIKALQTVGQMIGEVIKALDEEKCRPCVMVAIVLLCDLSFLY